MNRREFLKAAAAVPAVAVLPSVAFSHEWDVTAIEAATEKLSGYAAGPWYVLLHPSTERDLRDIQNRERWVTAYRMWRKDGKPDLSCQQILHKYTPISYWDFPKRTGEIGKYEGVNFIVSDSPVTYP